MRKLAFIFIVMFILPALAFAGGRDEETPEEATVEEQEPAPEPAPAVGTPIVADDPEKFIAVVNGVGILRSEYELRVQQTIAAYLQQGTPVPDSELPALEAGLLDQLVATELLYQEALSQGIEPDALGAELQFQQTKQQFPSDEAWEQALAANNTTEDELKSQIERGTVIQQIVTTALEEVEPVTQDEIQVFYDENPGYFQTPEQVTASHILISTEGLTDEEKAEALSRTETIREELLAGADFATVAQEKSEGPSGVRGGDLGTFGRGQMVAPFEEAAFNLDVGTVSEIVETQFGYHIILVREKEEASVAPIEDVTASIEQFLASEKQNLALEGYVEELRADAEIVFNN